MTEGSKARLEFFAYATMGASIGNIMDGYFQCRLKMRFKKIKENAEVQSTPASRQFLRYKAFSTVPVGKISIFKLLC